MSIHDQISSLLDRLISEGKELASHTHKSQRAYCSSINDEDGLRRWSNDLILFVSLAKKVVKPWENRLSHGQYNTDLNSLLCPLAALETIRHAIDEGLLTSYEDIVYAEAFSDLTEQGQHLLSQGYFLAAGVVFRAVLEEHLRRLCEKHQCMPEKKRPTINDLNTALYKCDPPLFSKSVMMQVTALAVVGNDAAHNKSELTKEDVKRLQDGLLGFLASFAE